MTEQRPPYLHAALASASALLLYVLTLAPTTSFWDASEYIATAYIVGLPHPPGNPFFVLLGRVWTLLLEPTGLSVADIRCGHGLPLLGQPPGVEGVGDQG